MRLTKNLRVQLLASHMLALAVMLVVIVGAALSFVHLGRSIDRVIEDNYRSVQAVQGMKDALARIDNAVMLLLAGERALSARRFAEAARQFETAHDVAANNITETGEQELSAQIGRSFEAYRASVAALVSSDRPLSAQEVRRRYLADIRPASEALEERADGVLLLNQSAMIRANARAKTEAQRASWIAVVATIGAFGIAVAVAMRMVGLSLNPLLALAQQAKEIGAGRLTSRIAADRRDEIGTLADAFNRMAEELERARELEVRRLHRAERMSDQALQSLYDPVIVTDAAGRIVHLNPAAEGVFGAAAKLIGSSASAAVGNAKIASAIGRAVGEERVTAAEDHADWIPVGSGSATRFYRLRATPMRDDDGTLLGAVAVLEDVTYLRDVDRLKSEFIAVASHELRTPITSLLLSVQLLEEGAAGPLGPAQEELVAAQRIDLERLDRLTRDLLDISRLESGRTPPRLEWVRPERLVEAAGSAMSAQASAKGVALETECDPGLPSVRADATQMVRALVNLLGNAVRHTPEGGRIRVTAALASGGSALELAVEDTGCGIAPEFVPRLFERFAQAPGASKGGAGLGLAIARTMVRAHGGDIRVASTPGVGSTFTIALPLSPQEEERR